MKVEKLYPSDLMMKQPEFQESQAVLPFFETHSAARKAFLRQSKRQSTYLLTLRDARIYLAYTQEKRQVTLTNLLISGDKPSWRSLLSLLEKFWRQEFIEGVFLPLDFGLAVKEWLTKRGYTAVQGGMVKNFVFHRALVLGGGGARGAYQIGVWEVLRNEGIHFDILTGTSVGALNGALILMDDVAIARDLWATISTDKILSFPEASMNSQNLKELLQQVGSLATTAIIHQGASTEPLRNLLRQVFNAEKMKQYKGKFFLCTTRLPMIQEIVHAFDLTKGEAELDWLVASSSFYPGMTPMQIEGNYYVDGGYRNNLPLDVAIQQGATECICVDVKGPGIDKKVRVPETIAVTNFRSPWSLGNLLVFDAERSEANYRLGYLDTMKRLGYFQGYWYTFTEETQWKKVWQGFLHSLKAEVKFVTLLQQAEFWEKVTATYQQKAPLEEGGLVFAELLGRILELSPVHVYSEKTFLEALKKGYLEGKTEILGSLSLSEWLQQYHNQRFALSEKNQLLRFNQLFREKGEIVPQLVALVPVTVILAKFLAHVLPDTPN